MEDALVHIEEGFGLQILSWTVLSEAFGFEPLKEVGELVEVTGG